jgi:hypothetical protein
VAGAISPRALRALIALGAAAVLALCAWFLLPGVGVVSARAARRRLRHESFEF